MAKSLAAAIALNRTRVLAAAALVLFATGEASAGVGVTSATDGDPLGKPPAEAERVLRIGIDVQANELITTTANDRAHLVFLDGSSLTVGPNARLTIDKFVYDPATNTGDLAINASRGVFRLVGGKISKTRPIAITTPSNTIGVRGGIAILDVKPGQTTSTFLFGTDMTVKAGGLTQTAFRPGSQVVTNAGERPGPATLVPPGGLSGQLKLLEGGRAGGQSGSRNADQAAESSGFSARNSGQAGAFGTASGASNLNPGNTAVTVISNANATALSLQRPSQVQPLSPALPTGPVAMTGPVSAPLPPVSAPASVPVPAVLPSPVSAPLLGAVSAPPPGPAPSPPTVALTGDYCPPPMHHHHHHGARPAIGVGNGGLVPAIPAGGRR